MSYTFEPTPAAPGFQLDWPSLRKRFAWIAAMAGVQQDPAFHAEGDVEIHTRMVAEALVTDRAWRDRADVLRHADFAAALLHDVSKPECTLFEENRWQSPNHARAGEKKARNLLWRGEAGAVPPFHLRERICKLVRYHGLPLRFIDKPDPEGAVVAASVDIDIPALITIARADVNGRICADQQGLHDRIDMFAALASELRVMNGPYPFESGQHRFSYFVGRKPIGYASFDDAWGEVTCMSGIPGSGKSTWVKQNAGDLPVVRMDDVREQFDINPDDPRRKDFVLNTARDRAIELLRKKSPFVWDATMLTKEFRASIIALIAKYGARAKVVYCEAPTYEETLRRNRERDRRVPDSIIDAMAKKLEIPNAAEAHEVIYAV